MKQFNTLTSTAISIRTENIDTDQIVPARFLKITSRNGFGKYLFYDWRYDDKDKKKNNSIFNNIHHARTQILIAGNNFGCGSSREHAVWALQDFGFKVIISSSYGDIFYNNSLKNGLLPVIIKPNKLEKLYRLIEHNNNTMITIDLQKQTAEANSFIFRFPIDSFHKTCLIKGIDELSYILSFREEIDKYEKKTKINSICT